MAELLRNERRARTLFAPFGSAAAQHFMPRARMTAPNDCFEKNFGGRAPNQVHA